MQHWYPARKQTFARTSGNRSPRMSAPGRSRRPHRLRIDSPIYRNRRRVENAPVAGRRSVSGRRRTYEGPLWVDSVEEVGSAPTSSTESVESRHDSHAISSESDGTLLASAPRDSPALGHLDTRPMMAATRVSYFPSPELITLAERMERLRQDAKGVAFEHSAALLRTFEDAASLAD